MYWDSWYTPLPPGNHPIAVLINIIIIIIIIIMTQLRILSSQVHVHVLPNILQKMQKHMGHSKNSQTQQKTSTKNYL